MAEQPQGAQANAPVTDEGIKLAQEYDKNQDEARASREETELSDGVKVAANGGAVVVGTGQLGQQSMFVGKTVDDDAEFVRTAKGLDSPIYSEDAGDGPREATSSEGWTAQSARSFQEANPLDVPGQTFTVEELPDPRVVSASILPEYQIPVGLVVEGGVTDSLNTGQERGTELHSGNRVESGTPVKARQSREDAEKPAPGKTATSVK